MTKWHPDTCHCIIDLTKMEFLEQCETHNTPDEVLIHNRSFNLKHGANPTDSQKEKMIEDKALEKKKPKFQKKPK